MARRKVPVDRLDSLIADAEAEVIMVDGEVQVPASAQGMALPIDEKRLSPATSSAGGTGEKAPMRPPLTDKVSGRGRIRGI